MSHLPKVFTALQRLLHYPDTQPARNLGATGGPNEPAVPAVQAAELLFIVLQDELPEAARHASQFGAFAEQHEPWDLEEAYTRTFDVNPACALEVGWHLFGEEYARGMFLVRMRQELRKYGLAESAELPDHITHVLDVVQAMPEDEATRFVKACVQPAVEKMATALAGKETPYRHVVQCLAAVLRHVWGEQVADTDQPTGQARNPSALQSLATDPLHAFPVGDIGNCSSSCGQPELVPLQIEPTIPNEAKNPVREASKP